MFYCSHNPGHSAIFKLANQFWDLVAAVSTSIYNLKHMDADPKYSANIHFKTKNKKVKALQASETENAC